MRKRALPNSLNSRKQNQNRWTTSTSLVDRLHGIVPALPTPLTRRREVDVPGLERLLGHVLSNGVHGLWLFGSSGEFTALSDEERKLILQVCVREVKRAARPDGHAPVIVGIGDNDVRKVNQFAELAVAEGADACFVVLPFYFALDTREAVSYLKGIAQSIPLPLLLYDNPPATKVKLPVSAFLHLRENSNIVGLKDSSTDYNRFQELYVALREATDWKIFQGDERLIGSSLLWGADGAVAALASVAPRLFVELYDAAIKADTSQVFVLQKRVLALTRLFELKGELTDGAFFAGLKAALRVLGICGETVASPFSPLPRNKIVEVEKLLRTCKLT